MSNEIEINDILGTKLEAGDLVFYCPGSKRNATLKIGIFVGVFENEHYKAKAKIIFVSEFNRRTHHVSMVNLKTFSSRCAIIPNPLFHINSEKIITALKLLDDLKCSGII